MRLVAALCLLMCVASPRSAGADREARMLEEQPRFGVYYDRYEPAFYTGFAPRTLDPRRLHVHIGRGNQLRVTAVLADDVLHDYAGDLLERDRTYRALVDSGRLVLTQNHGFEQFERSLADAQVARLVAGESGLPGDEVKERNLRLLERLNPGRVFRIRIPVDELIGHWMAGVRSDDHVHMDDARRLELVNSMLPTRLFASELDPDASAELAALVERVPAASGPRGSIEEIRPAFLNLFERVTHGIYPVRDGAVQFAEFTAVYPIGTLNQSTTLHGREIPEYPTPGRRALTTHQRTLTNDHVPTDQSYSYFPWLPYIHIGTRMHDALHTLFWQMKPSETAFLPASWREAKDPDGRPYQYLWLLSRGPMSHGCTHVNAGHISELRQLLPAEAERLSDVDVFYNQSPYYDVFDIDGDLSPEVIGVRYFIAYSLKDQKPDRLRAPDERHAYYDWLYAGELGYDSTDRGVFSSVRDGRFAGRTAVAGTEYEHIPLYEADYEPEKIQFYRLVDIPFAQELRRVGLHHPFAGLDVAVSSVRSRGPAAASLVVSTGPDLRAAMRQPLDPSR